jgi:hypothetical protein
VAQPRSLRPPASKARGHRSDGAGEVEHAQGVGPDRQADSTGNRAMVHLGLRWGDASFRGFVSPVGRIRRSSSPRLRLFRDQGWCAPASQAAGTVLGLGGPAPACWRLAIAVEALPLSRGGICGDPRPSVAPDRRCTFIETVCLSRPPDPGSGRSLRRYGFVAARISPWPPSRPRSASNRPLSSAKLMGPPERLPATN